MKIKMLFIWLWVVLAAYSQTDSIITIRLAGDLMIASWGESELVKRGMENSLHHLKNILYTSDINMCNLEMPFTTANQKFPEKTYTFKAKPEYVNMLKLLKINYVTLANNHTMDYLTEGIRQTIQTLDSAGIYHSGAGLSEKEAMNPAIFKIKNKLIGVVAAGAIFPREYWATDSTAGVFFPWREKLIRVLKETRARVDILMVTFHWGAEKKITPKKYQKGLARLCIKYGADVVWGHHPHVVQGVEVIQEKPIFYSLGNFIFASYSTAANGMMAEVRFAGSKMIDFRVIPLHVQNDEIPLQPYPLKGQEKTKFIKMVNALSDSIRTGVQFDSTGLFVNKN